MQKIWADALSIDVTTIGLDENFFQLGGDSHTQNLLRPVTCARRANYSLGTSTFLKLASLFRQSPSDGVPVVSCSAVFCPFPSTVLANERDLHSKPA